MNDTYCNPLAIPGIPVSRVALNPEYRGPWWREFGDPSVIRFKGMYYLFTSCAMVWSSPDLIRWQKHEINLNDVGWAPAVAEKDGRLYLTASWEGSRIWTAADPLGRWECLGEIKDEKGEHLSWADPALFTDADGTMYCYYSLGVNRGLRGVPLCSGDPTRFAAAPTRFFEFNPDHWWERFGECNQNPYFSHLEGASMTRHGGRYYLQYSAAGAEWRNYSVGCYVADHPLGPFTPQKRNPVLIQRGGMINGCGHNSIVEDEQGRLWCFYTILMRRFRGLERRIGMDPVRFDENGELYVDGPSETPVRIDGTPTGRLLLSAGQPVEASSFRDGHEPDLALDNYIRTYYEAAPEDPAPTLTVDLLGRFDVAAVRVIFHEKLTPHEVLPARFRFLVEGTLGGETWFPLADCRGKTFDGHIRYETFAPRSAVKVRLTVTGTPGGLPAGVVDFAVFGNASEAGYRGEPR